MPIAFTLLITILAVVGLSIPFSHLFWPQVIEGQVGKQSFVAHMIESWMKGDTQGGFPIRFFVEPWHPGPAPWAEEVPLFHWIAAAIGKLTGMNAVHAGRVSSFLFALVLLYSVRQLAKILFPAVRPSLDQPVARASKTAMIAVWLAPALLTWLPGFQIYSASVIPDLGMLAMIALAYSIRLRGEVRGNERGVSSRPSAGAYGAIGIACLLKYFAFFALLALFIYDCLADPDRQTRVRTALRAFALAALAGIPTLAYLYYFISHHIPNPITDYMSANGYGHLAGPFLFQPRFYLRFVTWVFVKNPTLPLSLCAVAGFVISRRSDKGGLRAQVRSELYAPGWKLLNLHLACYFLFALIFASSFFVHDYYALPFLLPTLFYACVLLSWLLNDGRVRQAIAGAIVLGVMTLGYLLARDATFRLTNYLAAAERVREALPDLADRSADQMVIFSSDFSLPVLPILSQKAGWAFNAEELAAQGADLKARLAQPNAKAFVFYAREPGASVLLDQWKAADPRLSSMKVVADQTWPSEGRKGAMTRLVVLRP